MSSRKGKKSNKKSSPSERTGQQQDNDYIEKIWKVFKRANAEQRKKIISELDEDMVTELRIRGNPYRQSALYKQNKGRRILLFSMFSPKEDDIHNFAMTSLIGFIFRMLDEYTPPEAKKYMSEMDPKFVKLYDEIREKFEKNKPLQILNNRIGEIDNRLEGIATELEKISNVDDNVDDELSADDEEEISPDEQKKILNKEKTRLERERMEVKAKMIIHSIAVNTKEIADAQPSLKSLKADVDRQKETRQYVKDIMRKLLDEKKHATVEKPVPVPESETDATSAPAPAPAEKVGNVRKKPHKSATKSTTVKHRPLETIQSEIALYDGKLAGSKEALEIAEEKLAAHEAMIADFESLRSKYQERLTTLQNNYYKLFGTNSTRGQNKQSKTKGKHGVQKRGGRRAPKPIAGSNETNVKPQQTVFDHLTFDECKVTDEDDYYIKDAVKQRLNIEQTQEECSDRILDHIEEFLYEYLSFNPDIHVKSSYAPNYRDDTRTPLDIDPETGMLIDENYERRLVPPKDTFLRWKRYREANYEQLRQATDDIYDTKRDYEWAFIAHETFEGADAEEKSEIWQRKHAKEVDLSIRSVDFNCVCLIDSWKANRERLNYYTKDTEILKRMFDTKKEEERFANQMTKERMRKKKAENDEEMGNDAGLNQYLENNPSGIERYGAKRMLSNNTSPPTDQSSLTAANIPRDDRELEDNEVQIDVINLGAKRVGRRFKPTSESWKFHLDAQPLKEGSVITHTPAEFHKKLKSEDRKD